jgi:hypothetical protein
LSSPVASSVIGGIKIISIAVATIFDIRRRHSQAASAGVGASQPMLDDGTVVQSSSGSPPTMKVYVCVFMSHAAEITCLQAPFSSRNEERDRARTRENVEAPGEVARAGAG